MTARSVFEEDGFPVLSTTLWEAFEDSVERDPRFIAVIDGEREVTRGELAYLAASAAQCLATAGVRRGDRVVMKGENDISTIAACLAVARLGAILVPCPSKYGIKDMTFICRTVEPRVVICALEDDTISQIGDVRIVTMSDLASGDAATAPVTMASCDDVTLIGFTAGTTGRPKGVMQTAQSFNYTTARWCESIGLEPLERVFGLLPMSYLSGYAFNVHMPLSRGMSVVCLSRWDPVQALELLASKRCNWSTSITSHVIMMLEAADRLNLRPDLSALRGLTCGGAPIPDDMADRVEALGVKLLRAYGLSECLGTAMMRPSDPLSLRRYYDGHPMLNMDVEVFDEQGNVLPRGQEGICGMRGPALFTGYWGEPQQTTDSFGAAGFLMTGDLVVRTEEGFVKVVGRVKDFIIRGGTNIDPVEIEELLRGHPAVRDVAVVGYPDERLGERACACVVLEDGACFSFDEMVDHLEAQGLTRHKFPERYLEVQSIPLSSVGKPLKSELRELISRPPSDISIP